MFGSRLIDVVEAAYRLDRDDHAWLAGLAEATLPVLNRGMGVFAYLGETHTLRPLDVALAGVTEGIVSVLRAIENRPPGSADETYLGRPMQFVSISEAPFFGDATLRGHWEDGKKAFGLVDGVGVYVHAAQGRTMHLFAPSASIERPHARERKAWLRIAVHIASGHRVRALLEQAPMDSMCDAILDSSGRVHDARNAATSKTALQALREAVSSMETARGPMRRSEGERALSLWRGLVAGRWSLLDRWDSDGKRFVVAIENRPDNLDPRALTPREGAAARLASEGAAPKDIAYALGISPSNARAILASALAKLGLTSRADLFRWNPSRARVHVVASEPHVASLVVDETSPRGWTAPSDCLTEAELVVARLAADGLSNVEIARRRGTAVRTIANQMACILRKLGISSRSDILRCATVLRDEPAAFERTG